MMSKATRPKKPKLKAKKPVKRTAKRAAAPPEKEITRGRGRPSEYSPELASKICNIIADNGTLKDAAKKTGIGEQTILDWLDARDDFSGQYARARARQADGFDDEITLTRRLVAEGEMDANAARVIIDSLKWQASKRAPKRYGDRLTQDVTVTEGEAKPDVSESEGRRWIKNVLEKRKVRNPNALTRASTSEDDDE